MAHEAPILCPHCGEPIDVDTLDRLDSRRPKHRMRIAAVIQGLLGSLIVLSVPLMILGFIAESRLPPGRRPGPAAGVGGMAEFLGAAAFLLVTGWGAWKCRRWARPLVLSVLVPVAALGAVGVAALAEAMPVAVQMGRALRVGMRAALDLPPRHLSGVVIGFVVIATLIGVVVPAALAALYWNPRLKRACERLDPKPRWTDGVPLPVLGTSLWLGVIAVRVLLQPAYGAVPVFGSIPTGWAAVPYVLPVAAAAGVISVAAFRRRPSAWYGTMALVLLLGASYLVTYARVNLIDVYRAARPLQPQQLKALEVMDLRPLRHAIIGGVSVAWIGVLAFLLYLRKFFTSPRRPGSVAAP